MSVRATKITITILKRINLLNFRNSFYKFKLVTLTGFGNISRELNYYIILKHGCRHHRLRIRCHCCCRRYYGLCKSWLNTFSWCWSYLWFNTRSGSIPTESKSFKLWLDAGYHNNSWRSYGIQVLQQQKIYASGSCVLPVCWNAGQTVSEKCWFQLQLATCESWLSFELINSIILRNIPVCYMVKV